MMRSQLSIGPILSLYSKRVWPWLFVSALGSASSARADGSEHKQELRRLGADIRTLNRLRALMVRRHRMAVFELGQAKKRARWTGAVPDVRLRFAHGIDDGLRSSLSLDESSLRSDSDSTASRGHEKRFIGELRFEPGRLVFHPSEIQLANREAILKGNQLELRLKVARLFMARRSAIIRWQLADDLEQKRQIWNTVLEKEVELNEVTDHLFSKVTGRVNR